MLNVHSLEVGALATNCYIVEDTDTKSAMIIDAPDEADRILEFVDEKGLTVTDIVLTHGHFDHIFALHDLKAKTNATVSVFEKTVAFLSDPVLNLCHYTGDEFLPFKPDRVFFDGDVLTFGKNEFKVIATPGHTEDSICLLCGDILISGDTLFYRSVGRCDHPTGDMKTELHSIKEKLLALPDDTKVYPGHGPSTTIGDERKENFYIL